MSPTCKHSKQQIYPSSCPIIQYFQGKKKYVWMLAFKLAILEGRWYPVMFKFSMSNPEVLCSLLPDNSNHDVFLPIYSVVFVKPCLFFPASPFQLSNMVLQSVLPSKSNLLRCTSFYSFFLSLGYLKLSECLFPLCALVSLCL